MSDATGTPLIGATPTVTTTATEGSAAPAPAPVVTESSTPAKPLSAREQIQRIKNKGRGVVEVGVVPSPAAQTPAPAVENAAPAATGAPITDAQGNLHGTDGKFVPKPAGDEPAAVAPTPGAAAEAVADVVKLGLPEGHPLRDRGLTELPFAVPKEHEEVVRSLLNEPVRKQQVAQAYEQARNAERQALEAQAEAQFWRDNAGEFLTPEFYAQYADIRQTYGDAAAETFKAGQMQAARQKLDVRRAEVGQQLAAQQIDATAKAFRAAVFQDTPQRYPGWTPDETNRALQVYGAWLHATGTTEPTAADWYRIADPLYAGSPAGNARRADEARRIQAEAEQRALATAKENERLALEAAARQRQGNPLGSVPNVQTGLTVPGTANGPRNAREWRKQINDRARGLA